MMVGVEDKGLISAKECAGLAGVRLSRWYEFVRRGVCPGPVNPYYQRNKLWRRAEIVRWLDGQPVTASDALA